MADLAGVRDPVAAALAFLAARQQPSGGFETRVSLDHASDPGTPDPSLFATAFVARALGACGAVDPAPALLGRAVAHLRTHMEAPGVWRHWTPEHPQFVALPVDADDTACISSVLADHGGGAPDNAAVLLANRDRRGLFRTWVIPHWPPPRDLAFWRVAARRARHPLAARGFWTTSAEPSDVDAVVNAHVLRHLGEGPHARAVVAHLVSVVRAGTEDRADKWYRSAFMFHAAVARCAEAGVPGLDAIREECCERLVAAVAPDGAVGSGVLDAALALRALVAWDAGADARVRIREHLARTQDLDGSWAAEPFYYGGPRHHPQVPSWGSREVTTGVCLEALARA